MPREIKIETCKPIDKVVGAFTPYNEVMEEDKCPTAEKMRKEFPELFKKQTDEIKGDQSHKRTPVEAKYNGIEAAKPQTDFDEYEDDSDVFETKPKSVLKEYQKDIIENELKKKYSENVLTPEEEKTIKEKFAQEKTDKVIKQIEDLAKEYVPGENVDKTKKINDLEFIRKVAMSFGLEKYFVPIDRIEKEVYEEPICEVKLKKELTFEDIAKELVELHNRKNSDYGNAAHQSYLEFGIISYVIRLNDKLNRLKSLTKPGATMKVQDESIIDTLKDLAAYAIMAIESLNPKI